VRQAIAQRAILPAEVPSSRVLPVADDIAAAARRSRLRDAILRVGISPPAMVDALEVHLNGDPLTPLARDSRAGWLTFEPPPDHWRQGHNELRFQLGQAQEPLWQPVQVTDVELRVRYHR
jgi:hypothetical protein